MSVEGYGLCSLGGAVGCHVADLVLLAVAAEGGVEGLAVAVGGDGEPGYGCAGVVGGVTRGGVEVQQLAAEGCTGGVSLRRAAGKG